jgi:hypothetical protein
MNAEFCLVKDKQITLLDLDNLQVHASSSAADEKYCIDNLLSSDDSSYWMSNINEKDVYL